MMRHNFASAAVRFAFLSVAACLTAPIDKRPAVIPAIPALTNTISRRNRKRVRSQPKTIPDLYSNETPFGIPQSHEEYVNLMYK